MNTITKPLWLTLLLMTLGHFLVDFMIGIWPVYKTMMGLDLAKAGLIAGVCAFIGEGVQIFFGPMGDRGHRKFLTIFGVTATVATVFVSYTIDYWVLFLIYLTTCIGSGAFHPSAVGVVNNMTANRKGLFIAIFAAGGSFGIAISQLIFTGTYLSTGGHTFFLAIPSLLLMFYLLRYPFVNNTQTSAVQGSRIEAFKNFFINPDLRRLYFATLCNQTVSWGLIFLLPDALKSRGYEEWLYFGGGHMAMILGAGCMVIPAGYLADKYSPRSVILVSILTGITMFYLFLMSPVLPAYAVCSVLFLAGAGIGLVQPLSTAYGNQLMPNQTGVVNACLMGLVWCFAEAFGQIGGGFLTTLFEVDAPIKALMVMGVLAVPALGLAYSLPADAEEPEFPELA